MKDRNRRTRPASKGGRPAARPRRPVCQPTLEVSAVRLRHNLALLRRLSGCGVCATVKADAYGHGAAGVAAALFGGSDPECVPVAFAVATPEEAVALPPHDVPIVCLRPAELVWAGDNTAALDAALRRGVWVGVTSVRSAGDVARRAERLGVRADVHVMLDTGMCREGCDARHFASVIAACLDSPALRLTAVGTHFTDGELADEPYSDDQIWLFHEAIMQLHDLGRPIPPGVIRHVANSGATLTGHGTGHADGFDWTRCGLALYGIDPCDGAVAAAADLAPVARLVAPLLDVRDVSQGMTVGYGRTWRASRASRMGLVPVGYADGYPRALSDVGVVRHVGSDGTATTCRVAGRVSMDYAIIDLTDTPHAAAGDEVVLIDDDPRSPCSAAAIARACDTIPYEIMCGIGPRVCRRVVE